LVLFLKENITTTFIYICAYLYAKELVMESKNITLRVNSELYDEYRGLCKKKGLLVSRQVEIMMEEQIENGKE
jgi:hypothetical protein